MAEVPPRVCPLVFYRAYFVGEVDFLMVAKTKVSEVQVYRSSAMVIRQGETVLKAGRNLLYVAGMTNSADTGSFKLKFPEKIRAINIQIVDMEAVKDKDSENGIGKTESEILKKQMDEVAYQIETCNMMLELRKKNGDFSNRTNISIEEQEKIMSALPEQLLDLHRQLDALSEKKAELQEKYDEAVTEERKPLIMAELNVEEDMKVPFLLQYQETQACWTPKYEIQYTDDKSPLDVRMKGQILQNSGEDWLQVKTTLYTGNPSVSNDLPVLPSRELSLYTYEPPRRSSRMKAMGAMPMDDCCEEEDTAVGAAAPQMLMGMASLKMDTADVSEEETMTAFQLPNLRDILNDTDGNIADLQFFTVKAGYHVLAVPSVDNKCYLTAEIVASEWPLPPADAAVYLRDAFAGEVWVDPNADTDLLTLSLGQDERLTVVRTEAPKKTQEGFLKSSKKQLCRTEIKIVNTSSEPVSALIKDQVPVSTEKSIEVEKLNLSDGILDEDSGEVKWEIKAEPNQTLELVIEYSISWPKDKNLSERRRVIKAKTRFCPNCGTPVAGKFCPECGSVVE